jgi:hypothetical protein
VGTVRRGRHCCQDTDKNDVDGAKTFEVTRANYSLLKILASERNRTGQNRQTGSAQKHQGHALEKLVSRQGVCKDTNEYAATVS